MKFDRLDLSAAVAAAANHAHTELTLAELARLRDATNPDTCCQSRLRKWLMPDVLGSISAWKVQTSQIQAVCEGMHAMGYKPATINRDVASVSALYIFARRQRYSPRDFKSPTIGIERYTEQARVVEVTAAEIEALKLAAKAGGNPLFHLYVCMSVDSACRASEITERKWHELKDGRILLKTSKTGVPRYLFFKPETLQLAERLRKPRGLIFANRAGAPTNFRSQWARATKAIGRPDLHRHDLRHYAAADFMRKGVGIGMAAQVLGHSVTMLAKRYGHLAADDLLAAQEQRWEAA